MASRSQLRNYINTLEESYELLQLILDRRSHKPLHIAVLLRKREIARVLMVGGINIENQDEDNNTALHLACITENYGMAKILLTPYGAPITRKCLDQLNGQSCLHIAAYRNRWDFIRLLIGEGACINVREATTGGTPLHTAVAYHNILVIQFILDYCNPNLMIENYAGETADSMADRLFSETY